MFKQWKTDQTSENEGRKPWNKLWKKSRVFNSVSLENSIQKKKNPSFSPQIQEKHFSSFEIKLYYPQNAMNKHAVDKSSCEKSGSENCSVTNEIINSAP